MAESQFGSGEKIRRQTKTTRLVAPSQSGSLFTSSSSTFLILPFVDSTNSLDII